MKIQCIQQAGTPDAEAARWDEAVEIDVDVTDETATGLAAQQACQGLYDALPDTAKEHEVHFWWRRADRPAEQALWSHNPIIKDLPKADPEKA